MGQIFNRLKNITKSYLSDTEDAEKVINSDEEDLKRIIEELNSEKKQQSEQKAESRPQTDTEMTEGWALGMLGLESGATIDQIKTAYKQRIKEYHPDRVETLGDEIKELAKKKTRDINSAYNFLKKTKGF